MMLHPSVSQVFKCVGGGFALIVIPFAFHRSTLRSNAFPPPVHETKVDTKQRFTPKKTLFAFVTVQFSRTKREIMLFCNCFN
jgi:hypothetical protein